MGYVLAMLARVTACLGGISAAAVASQPENWQMNFQKAAGPRMEAIEHMHVFLLIVISFIAVVVTALLLYTIFRFREKKNPVPSKTTHNTFLEVVWTSWCPPLS